MSKILTCLVVLATAATAAQQQPSDFRLDAAAIVSVPQAQAPNYRPPPYPFMVGTPRTKAVQVRLLSLDGRHFEWGDTFVYEVLVENTGAEPVVLPWSPDSDRFVGFDTRRAMSIRIAVETTDRGQLLGYLYTYRLWGADTMPGSTVTLKPRQRAAIRVPGRWVGADMTMTTILSQDAVRVRANVIVFEEHLVESSVNSEVVRVVPRASR